MAVFWGVVRRDLQIAMRAKADWLQPMLFFLVIAALFPLAIGHETAQLQLLGPGCVWIAALLAAILSLERMFRSDCSDGGIEQWLIAARGKSSWVWGKILVHWLTTGVPLLLFAPIASLWFMLDFNSVMVLACTLLLATPILSALGAVTCALTVGLARGGVLLSVLILPLYIPVLIFATSAVQAAQAGLNVTGQLALLAALLILSLGCAPYLTVAALKVSVE